jgi:hypothetical protein
MSDMNDTTEEIRQLCNKHGAPQLFNPICVLLNLDEDYTDESEELTDDSDLDDDAVAEKITVKKTETKNGHDFYKIVDSTKPTCSSPTSAGGKNAQSKS